MTQTDIKLLLTRWGTWSKDSITRISRDNLGYKSMWDLIMPCVGGCGNGSSPEVDAEMLAVDRGMQWLRQHSHFDYRMLKLKYRYGYSFNRIAEKLTRELPQYRKSKKTMHNTTAQNYVDLAEQTLLKYLQNNC